MNPLDVRGVLWVAAIDRVPIEERIEWVEKLASQVEHINAVRLAGSAPSEPREVNFDQRADKEAAGGSLEVPEGGSTVRGRGEGNEPPAPAASSPAALDPEAARERLEALAGVLSIRAPTPIEIWAAVETCFDALAALDVLTGRLTEAERLLGMASAFVSLTFDEDDKWRSQARELLAFLTAGSGANEQ